MSATLASESRGEESDGGSDAEGVPYCQTAYEAENEAEERYQEMQKEKGLGAMEMVHPASSNRPSMVAKDDGDDLSRA